MSGQGDTGAVGKVTAFVTRLGTNGPEVCVFDHPRAGLQLPAGTLKPGEDVCAGARREAFEETGLDDLRFRSEIAVVPASRPGTAVIKRATSVGGRPIGAGYLVRVLEHDVTQARIEVDGATGVVDLEALSFDVVRHLVHFVMEGAAPDEWFVTTPDGGGTCWRCHWLLIDAPPALNADQQGWLDAARGALLQARHPPARRRRPRATIGFRGGRCLAVGAKRARRLKTPSAASCSRKPARLCEQASSSACNGSAT